MRSYFCDISFSQCWYFTMYGCLMFLHIYFCESFLLHLCLELLNLLPCGLNVPSDFPILIHEVICVWLGRTYEGQVYIAMAFQFFFIFIIITLSVMNAGDVRSSEKCFFLLGAYNTSDSPTTIVIVAHIVIVVPLLSLDCYYCAP